MTEREPDPSPPTFESLPLSAELRESIAAMGYLHPTPVQRAVFEPAKNGRDLVVQARTGTGKTAAFGLPLIDALVTTGTQAVQAIALCPTRELALQVTREIEALGKHKQVHPVAVYGGAPMGRQIDALKLGPPILVGTPGRVLDHLRRGTLDATHVRTVVLDESDEMLSMGFLPQITEILGFLPEARQTLLFSATLPPDIRRVAETRLRNPEYITLSGDHIGALEIDHFVYLSRGDKTSELIKIIEIENPESAIVFCNTKDETKRVAGVLKNQGFNADWLNADLAQNERETVMRKTRENELRFLVATDVAARGIDVSQLTHVINFDFPESPEAYVHRTGRTGRAGRTGTAISLVSPSSIGNLYMLRLTYKLRPIERQLPSAQEERTRAESDLASVFVEAYGKRTPHPEDLALARRILTHDDAPFILAGLLRDHLGARQDVAEEAAAARRTKMPRARMESAPTRPAAERPRAARPAREREPQRESAEKPDRPAADRPAVPDRPAVSNRPAGAAQAAARPPTRSGESRQRENGATARPRPEPSRTEQNQSEAPKPSADVVPVAEIFVSLGQEHGLVRGQVEELLMERGFEADDIRFIRVRPKNTFVGVPPELLRRAVDALDGATLAGQPAQANPARGRGPVRR